MDLISMTGIALALAMDAFAVSIASGVIIKRHHLTHAIKFGFYFGFFQMFMPMIGWYGGSFFQNFIGQYDHWIAFILLSFIGIKMIKEANEMDYAERSENYFTAYILLGLAVATSIDALAVGLSFAFLGIDIAMPALFIGIVTFLFSFVGVLLGKKVGHIFEKKIEILGGVVLIIIGLKILIQHLLR
jgi:putative Mn2+ efflux pump MntP